MIGEKFNRLTVKHYVRGNNRGETWLCVCECGKEREATTWALKSGHIKSCGCLQRDVVGNLNKTHGKSMERLYNTWGAMKKRCYNKNGRAYHRYGGRGIVVCDEWKDDFEAFREWALSNGYEKHLTIDRIDTDGPYSPENCQWLTGSKNSRKMWIDQGERELPRHVYRRGNKYMAHSWSKHYIGTYETIEDAVRAVEAAQVA